MSNLLDKSIPPVWRGLKYEFFIYYKDDESSEIVGFKVGYDTNNSFTSGRLPSVKEIDVMIQELQAIRDKGQDYIDQYNG